MSSADMDTIQAVVDALRRAPRIVVPLVREVPPHILKQRPAPRRWSAHEHACHLAHVHGLFSDRLDYMLTHPAPVIQPYLPGEQDADDLLLQMDLDDALGRYVADRERLVARLETLSPAEWGRAAEHSEYRMYSVFVMFRHLALHDFLHAYRIEELLLNPKWAITADIPKVRELPGAVPEIPVSQLDSAANYYRDRLGFAVDWLAADIDLAGISRGPCRLFLAGPAFRGERAGPVQTWLNLASVAEVDALHRDWRGRGAKLSSSPESKPWGLYEFTAVDADGNTVRVFHDVETPARERSMAQPPVVTPPRD